MERKEIKQILDTIAQHEIENISIAEVKKNHSLLLNLVETLANSNDALEINIQQLKDEINRLKGEQGKPIINKQTKGTKQGKDHSSEKERKSPKVPKKKKPKKKDVVKIDRMVVLDIENKENLPDDLEFKGYETNIFQNIIITTDNVEFNRKVYYSPSLKKTYVAKLPDGYYGDFGPEVRALVISLYHDAKMTQPNIMKTFKAHGIKISKASISRILTTKVTPFHQEKEDVVLAGIKSTPFQHLDDTGARVNGKNHYTHILCNPFYTAYFTVPKKDRMTVLEILCRGELQFTFIEESFTLMLELGLSQKNLALLQKLVEQETVSKTEINNVLDLLFPPTKKKKQKNNRKIILEAAAIIYYQSTPEAIEFLICDDAPQFNHIATHKSLCWVHEGRHYKKLNPVAELHREALDGFISKFWEFYKKLLQYKENPCSEQAIILSKEFDSLFSTKTGYEDLDKRIALTLAKKDRLMLVLKFPFLPLHNNTAELGARPSARSRDVNLQTKNEQGTKAKDTFFTLSETATKLCVSFYDYILDRITKRYKMPSLASLIEMNSIPVTDTS